LIPLKDENPTLITPWLTYAVIALNVVVYFLVQTGGSELGVAKTNFRYSTIPYNVTHGADKGVAGFVTFDSSELEQFAHGPLRVQVLKVSDQSRAKEELGASDVVVQSIPWWATLITSMFMHGSVMHLLGNMLFLYVFSNNIEEAIGRFRFVVFYLVTGLIASLGHIFSDPDSMIPTLGASGAVSGILGGYLLLYPRARILSLIPLPFIWTTVYLPAAVFLVIWLGMQISGVLQSGGGVAWWAHIGGFLGGLALIKMMESTEHRERRERLQVTRQSAVWNRK
jgi:membrane associated rhomboid family serine protease